MGFFGHLFLTQIDMDCGGTTTRANFHFFLCISIEVERFDEFFKAAPVIKKLQVSSAGGEGGISSWGPGNSTQSEL